jgi:riboflavin biosynthesis pyrimidine reductase
MQPDYTSLSFPLPAGLRRPYVITNMVMSADGKVVLGETEQGLGSATDQRLMRELRVHADVVLNGAGTLRASGTSSRLGSRRLTALRRARGQSPAPIAAVLSRSGDLPLDRAFFTARDFEAVVYLSDAAPADRRRAIAATGRRVVTVPDAAAVPSMVRHMHDDLGAKRLLAEGGPAILGRLFAHDLVDEYFLSLSGVIVGGGAPTAVEGPRVSTPDSITRFGLVSAIPNPDDGEVYLRFRRRAD